MSFAEQEINQLAAMIWEATLGLPVEPASAESDAPASMLCATVRISGAWNGRLALACEPGFADRAACIMFDLRPAEVTGVHRSDAIGELANMIGGNVKALLPETCRLSLPTIASGLAAAGPDATRVALTCDDGTSVRIELDGRLRDAA